MTNQKRGEKPEHKKPKYVREGDHNSMKNEVRNLADDLAEAQAQAQMYKEDWEAERKISKAYSEATDKLRAKVRGFEKRAFRYGVIVGTAIGLFFTALGIMIGHYI